MPEYRYDTETGLYYLQSRYYDPNTGRFLNADDTGTLSASASELTDKNLFAYCGNNPVIRADDSGSFWHILIGAGVGAAISGALTIGSNIVQGKTWYSGLGKSLLLGAASGALAATGVGLLGQIAGNAALSMIDDTSDQIAEKDGFSYTRLIVDGAIGGIAGGIGGRGSGGNCVIKDAEKLMNKNIRRTITYRIKNGAKAAVKNYLKRGAVKKFYKGLVKSSRKNVLITAGQQLCDFVNKLLCRRLKW